jgi:hypothetical protein
VSPPESRTRLRVSVKYSVRDPTLLVVRSLADGQSAPAGTHEGYLVLSEATTDPTRSSQH